MESIFADLRNRLKDKINFSIKISSRFNDGYFSKLYNIIEAAFRQEKHAISHITGEIYFLNLLMRKRNVLLTIHDCRFMERKKGFKKKLMAWLYLKAPVKKAVFVTAISESTKKDITRHTAYDPGSIYVIPNAVHVIYQPYSKSFTTGKPVILQIGTGPNKNIERLAEALQGITCTLNIIGKISAEQSIVLKKNAIDYTDHYNLSEKAMLEQYQACDLLTFVSTSEGFGMPIIEANCVERAVLTSDISSMPEVAGDAACLVNPYNAVAIKNGILRLINDEAYREELIANGRKNKLRFDADTIANQYYALYKKIATNFHE